MKKLLPVFVVCFIAQTGVSNPVDIEQFLRPYADKILDETVFAFIDRESGDRIQSTDDLGPRQKLSIDSEFLQWHYTSALVYGGLREFGNQVSEDRYVEYGDKAFAFVFNNKGYLESLRQQGFTIEGLENFVRFKGVWNDGAQVAELVNVYQENTDPDYLEYMKQVAVQFMQSEKVTATDGSALNIDQVYAKAVFMARMGRLTGDQRYFDYCERTIAEWDRMFYDPRTGLYDHYYYTNSGLTNGIKWLRGIGWAAIGIANVLVELPEDHPGYGKLLTIYQKLVAGISPYQTESGLWRHLVDRVDCFEETSGSTYIVYAMALGINNGLLDPVYRDVAMAGWWGIVGMQDASGHFKNVTPGVSGSTSPSYYYNTGFDESSSHLYGPLFLAGTEMIKLYRRYDRPKVRDWNPGG